MSLMLKKIHSQINSNKCQKEKTAVKESLSNFDHANDEEFKHFIERCHSQGLNSKNKI